MAEPTSQILGKANDVSWIRQCFFLPGRSLEDADASRRSASMADTKYTDTSLGGNFIINARPGFTPNADIRPRSKMSSWSRGMGRYYSEAIDDNTVKVHMRFGVPEYNALTTFFANIYDPQSGSMAQTGKPKGIFFTLGQVVGFVVALPLMPFVALGRAWRFFANKPYSKFYYLKPTMFPYWNTVNNICNSIAVNMGLMDSVNDQDYELVTDPETGIQRMEPVANAGLNDSDVQAYRRMMPDIFRGDNSGIDIYAVANRAQRMADAQHMAQQAASAGIQNLAQLQEMARATQNGDNWEKPKTRPTLAKARKAYEESSIAKGNPENDSDRDDPLGSWENNDAIDYFAAELRDGSAWITVGVNNEDNASESFSNSTKQSDLQDKINGASAAARNARFSTANGNIADNPVVNLLETVVGSAKDLAMGALDGIGLAGLAVTAGSAFVDIPEHWEQSVANLPSKSYTMELRSPYGNKMSIFMNLYVPLAMLLAGALPLSTGKGSYTSPFLVELYSKGRAQTRLAIIDSLEIKRGVGNVGWSNDHLPLGLDISFSVKDLSTVMHAPISDSFGLFDDDTAFSDYMAVLGSLGLTDQVYGWDRFKRNLNKSITSFEQYTSPAYYSAWAASTMPGRMMSSLARSTAR